jgi:predicted Ser/Thr protein kinase
MKKGFETETGSDSSSSQEARGNRTESRTPPGGFVPPEPEQLAKQFPQLEILDLLGRGGMGAVYKARQPQLDRFVALKILPAQIGEDPQFAERFTREARALAKLNHPNIVAVYDFGTTEEGLFYFIMEFVDGPNLRHVIQGKELSPEQALAIVPQICDALQYAHEEEVVHRDIKPENVLLDKKGRVKIADFGLAKLLGVDTGGFTLTGTQQVMGTPHYMAPEQFDNPLAVDHRADIYSLGVVLYEMLTGELPIGRFAPPSQKVQIDVRLDEVVLKTLENKPDLRYQHASEVKTDVERCSRAAATTDREATVREAITSSFPPGHAPRLLFMAIGACTSGIVVLVGLGLVLYGFLAERRGSPEFWGWMGIGLGCAGGGAGGLFSSYRQYRHFSRIGEREPQQIGNPKKALAGLAVGMVVCGLLALVGLVLVPVALMTQTIGSNEFWGFIGAALGCGLGGLGGLAGTWNSYRRLEGAPDLMDEPGWTWFDVGVLIVALLGISILVGAFIFSPVSGWSSGASAYSLILMGGIFTWVGGQSLLIRVLSRRARRQETGSIEESAGEAQVTSTSKDLSISVPSTPGVGAAIKRRWLRWYASKTPNGMRTIKAALKVATVLCIWAWLFPSIDLQYDGSGSWSMGFPTPWFTIKQFSPGESNSEMGGIYFWSLSWLFMIGYALALKGYSAIKKSETDPDSKSHLRSFEYFVNGTIVFLLLIFGISLTVGLIKRDKRAEAFYQPQVISEDTALVKGLNGHTISKKVRHGWPKGAEATQPND